MFCLHIPEAYVCNANRGQKRAVDVLELVLQAVGSQYVGAGN